MASPDHGIASDAARRRQARLLFWLCFAVAMVDGFDTLVVSFVAPALARDWDLSPSSIGTVFAAGLIGAVLGSAVAGSLADRLGRKTILLASVALFTLATFFCAVATGFGPLLALRVLAGLGLGGAIPTITALVAETLPPERRAASVTRMFLGFPIGAVLGGALCAALVPSLGWRPAFWLGGAFGLILLPLLHRGIRETAVRASGADPAAAHGRNPLGEGRLVPAVLVFAAAFLILLVSYFLINWTPTLLSASGAQERIAILGGVLLNMGGVAGALALSPVLDRFGPFRSVGLSLLGGALAILLLGSQLEDPFAMPFLVFLTGMGVIGGQLVLPALAAALFPQQVRATGVGLTMGIGRLGSIAGPFGGGLLLDAGLGWGWLFAGIAIPTAGAGALLLALRGRGALPAR